MHWKDIYICIGRGGGFSLVRVAEGGVEVAVVGPRLAGGPRLERLRRRQGVPDVVVLEGGGALERHARPRGRERGGRLPQGGVGGERGCGIVCSMAADSLEWDRFFWCAFVVYLIGRRQWVRNVSFLQTLSITGRDRGFDERPDNESFLQTQFSLSQLPSLVANRL
uniref:Uncharacterized protein n=1 Tax=Cryptomonas paramaecium TaxID=2898 RepID=A0A7S4PQI8_9CRYP